jgi:predicted nucleic acid-binding Zn ribbon protein/ribosomal protein L32
MANKRYDFQKRNKKYCWNCGKQIKKGNLCQDCRNKQQKVKIIKRFNKNYGTVCPKKECEKCGNMFVPDDEESCCSYCSQDPQEEIDYINERKERERMKKNGI